MTSVLTRPPALEGVIGKPIDRVDGRLKVTGAAEYAADANVGDIVHVVLVRSTIARGTIASIDESRAREVDGVVDIITHANAPKLNTPEFDFQAALAAGELLAPLQSDQIVYAGQYVAMVIGQTLESAQRAAERLHVEYAAQAPTLEFEGADSYVPDQIFGTKLQDSRGDVEAGLAQAAAHIDATYRTPYEHHVPIEPNVTLAVWNGDELTLHDSTQWVNGAKNTVAHTLGIPPDKVRVLAPYLGGGFGAKGFVWPHLVLASIAAQRAGKPAKLVLTREQTFTGSGHRSPTEQRVRLGATRDGALTAFDHAVRTQTSQVMEFTESAGASSIFLYSCPNVRIEHRTYRLNVSTPSPTRAPGEASGTYAVEAAMDELAVELGIDPLELRIRNHSVRDEQKNVPYSSKHLLECYERGAERFGWSKRAKEPRAVTDGRELVGWGMATATYPAMRSPAQVRIAIEAGGTVSVETAAHDIGTGMYTIAAQIAADYLGVDTAHIRVKLGDSSLPPSPVAGGSQSAASVGPAIAAAAGELRAIVTALAVGAEESPLFGMHPVDVEVRDGRVVAASDRARGLDFAQLVRAGGGKPIEAHAGATPPGEENLHFQSFGAHFIEVRVDEEIGRVRVARAVSAFDCGRVLNQKTARSQMIGGIVWGIGMALTEETILDPRGRFVTDNLADYHVPTNADVPQLDVLFVEEPDFAFNPMGARGMGEIGITGVAGAIANAVYHATGKRVRDLPITADAIIA